MTSSLGMIIPNIWTVIKFMFQTTNQNSYYWGYSHWSYTSMKANSCNSSARFLKPTLDTPRTSASPKTWRSVARYGYSSQYSLHIFVCTYYSTYYIYIYINTVESVLYKYTYKHSLICRKVSSSGLYQTSGYQTTGIQRDSRPIDLPD